MHANPDAEQYLLGCLLMDETLLRETEISPEHFFIPRHQEMFRRMRERAKKGERVDFLSMVAYDSDTAQQVYQSIPSLTLFRHYETLVVEAWKRRKAVELAQEMICDLDEYQDHNRISKTIRELTQIDEVGVQTEYNFSDRVLEVIEEIEHDDGEMKGISTGFRDLNAYLHGWHDEDLIIVGARPSVGKTAFALHTLLNAASQDVVCTLFALEMRDKSNIRRMISAHANIDATKMRAPKRFFSEADWNNIAKASMEIASMNIAIYDKPNITPGDIRTKVRSMKNRFPDKKHLVIIDYLQLMRGSNTKDKRVEQMGEVSRELKLLAREYQCPVIALSQLSRGVEGRQDKRPMMSDIRESGNIEQDADVILLLYRDDYYDNDSERQNIVEVNIAKQRNGRVGKVELVFMKELNRFQDLARSGGHE